MLTLTENETTNAHLKKQKVLFGPVLHSYSRKCALGQLFQGFRKKKKTKKKPFIYYLARAEMHVMRR